MNPNLDRLHPYPFEKLRQLTADLDYPTHLEPIALSIGEPKHAAPEFVKQRLRDAVDKLGQYPTTKGSIELRKVICDWLERRFSLPSASLDPEQQVLPVAGTREALFAFTQAVVDASKDGALVVSPNPFYQIYEGAALLAGAEVHYLNCDQDGGYIPDLEAVPAELWQRCQLLQLCSPGNPTGAVMSLAQYQQAIDLADRYDFVLSSDECYSEVYLDEDNPPLGLLDACQQLGRTDFSRCVVFHSLSKRSNLPGLRSGFIAGDKSLIGQFLNYRTYHGCALSLPVQEASIAAWSDETHVIENRAMYREKFAAVTEILKDCLEFTAPTASFYLWPKTPIDDAEFARGLLAEQHVTVLPGQFLSRTTASGNPGKNRVRMALVADKQQCIEAAERIKLYVQSLDHRE
ncbi:MAG: succinyldiaminopimelate transaminase [Porticoccaceae bacterium]|jgi:N-succinyldiaminopimelate aminotransferase|nr:succinyldiaminopimelate transaminase [Porticoccaceae bacterium]